MDPIVFAAVLFAAVLHAAWNAMVKHAVDKAAAMTAVVIGHTPFALGALLFVPAPAAASWPYVAAGAALHVGYQRFLIASYRLGDLSHVYPIARGAAPLIVAGVSVAVLGEQLSTAEIAGVTLIATGIMSLVLVRGADGMRNGKAARFALVTGVFIAGYSLVDGYGARAAGTAVGFYAWLSILNAGVFAAIMRAARPGLLTRAATDGQRLAIVGGGASFTAFAIVVWGFTEAPIALVSALRETSIVFALIIGVVFLDERLNLAKLASTAMTISGAVLLRFAK